MDRSELPVKSKTGIVVIASSTGGPGALLKVLPELPADFPYPVVIVQHMWVGFTSHFAKALGEKCALPVVEAEYGARVVPGHIYIAPAGKHLRIRHIPAAHIMELTNDPQRNGVRPSADYLFESLVQTNFDHVIAVVLTGMGCDGTEGIVTLSKHKKVTVIAQDEETSVVDGMPGSVRKAIPDCRVLPIEEIGEDIKAEIRKLMEG